MGYAFWLAGGALLVAALSPVLLALYNHRIWENTPPDRTRVAGVAKQATEVAAAVAKSLPRPKRFPFQPGWVRLLLARVVTFLDSDSVRPFIWLYYIPFLLWGLYGTFVAYPIALIVKPMGQNVYDAWVFAPIPGTLAVMLGLWLRHGGSPLENIDHALLRRDYLGLHLQFGGHVLMHVVLLVFVIAGIDGAHWGDPDISLFLLSSYVICTALLAAQCVRKIQRGRRFPC